ncbi:MAG: sigma-54 dependent transcriptional regulator [Deltaproteobacteria bacterium]|jgi:DNA-binding NtrC family response regulator|nr:sigma-54 dependent transcriptional regulator [Deltaproteobacteria bacterium]
MNNPAILIAEGDEILCKDLKGRLFHHGFEVIEALDQTSVLRFFQAGNLDLVIIGSFGDNSMDGLKTVAQIRRQDREVPLFLIARNSSEALVIAALRAGVTDYFKWPVSYEELIASVNRNLSYHKRSLSETGINEPMIGDSAAMREIKAYLINVATTDCTVLITGETGTGKELVAELIHQNSPRHKKPLVCINCAALPESLVESEMFGYERGAFTGAVASKRGKFELAEGGTVFLDEIGDMSPYAQMKILRTTEKKEVCRLGGKGAIPINVRVIGATNSDLEQLMEKGNFRKDLYYRLNVARIHLPPLRDRKEDIPSLLKHYISKFNQRFGREVEGFTEEALDLLFRYDWPGNVRELKNLIEATFINLSSWKIALMDLPKTFQRRFEETEWLQEKERDRVLSVLFATKWNKSKAAQKLHWSRMTLYRKMAKYHISSSQ